MGKKSTSAKVAGSSRRKKKATSLIDTYKQYNDIQTKGNIQNTFLKGAVDTLAGSVIGTGIGALTGSQSPIAGIILILSGHYLDDKSGLLRLVGASTLAYGIAKSKDYQNNPDFDTAQKRLNGLREDLLTPLHIKWKKEEEEQKKTDDENKTTTKNGSA